jgi:hypothetical protein
MPSISKTYGTVSADRQKEMSGLEIAKPSGAATPCPFFAKQNVPTSYQEVGATKTFQWFPKTAITGIKL